MLDSMLTDKYVLRSSVANCTEGNAIGIVDAESTNKQAIHRTKSCTPVSMRVLQCAL